MRPYFVTCSLSELEHHRYGRTNDPINLSRIIFIRKDQLKYYPDNNGIPAIKFFLPNDEELAWAYLDSNQRDEDYNRILQQFGPEGGQE